MMNMDENAVWMITEILSYAIIKKNHWLIIYYSYACLNVMHMVTLCYTFPLIQFLKYDFDVCCFLTKSFIRPLFQTIANWCCINHRGKSAQNFSCASAHISSPISRWRLNPGSDRRDHEGVRADRTIKSDSRCLDLKCVWYQCGV